ncbi:uncharacterized protein Hap1MRO34_002918 isoform 2-T10 [Clarias gariepinus]
MQMQISPYFRFAKPCAAVPQKRESLDQKIINSINRGLDDWGIHCLRYHIRNIHIPPDIKESMQMQERESLNSNIIHSINQASDDWGIHCLRYNIKNIHIPPHVKESMQMQVEEQRRVRERLYTADVGH